MFKVIKNCGQGDLNPHSKEPDSKSGASANSAMSAKTYSLRPYTMIIINIFLAFVNIIYISDSFSLISLTISLMGLLSQYTVSIAYFSYKGTLSL